MYFLLVIGIFLGMATCKNTCILPDIINCETAWKQMPSKLYQVFNNDDPFDKVTTCRTISNIQSTSDMEQLTLNFTTASVKFGYAYYGGVFRRDKPSTYRVIISDEERKDLEFDQKFIVDGRKEDNVGDFIGEFNSYLDSDHVFYSCDGKILIHLWCNKDGERAVQVSKGNSRPTAIDALYVRNTFIKWQNGWENVKLYTSSCPADLDSFKQK